MKNSVHHRMYRFSVKQISEEKCTCKPNENPKPIIFLFSILIRTFLETHLKNFKKRNVNENFIYRLSFYKFPFITFQKEVEPGLLMQITQEMRRLLTVRVSSGVSRYMKKEREGVGVSW